jgi:phage portal protein BeeE
VPELKFFEEQLTRMLLPRLGYPDLGLEFDLSVIEALQEDENQRVSREAQLLDRGVLTINEVRRQRGLPDVPWGDAGPACRATLVQVSKWIDRRRPPIYHQS